MCDYCEKEKPLFKMIEPNHHKLFDMDDELEISIYKGLLVCDVDGFGTTSIRIMSCPICKRDLEADYKKTNP